MKLGDWIPHTEVDFDDPDIEAIHIDTRDFHCNVSKEPRQLLQGVENEMDVYNHPEKYNLTAGQTKELIQRYYEESGGEGEWRCFSLEGKGKAVTLGWRMKYIRLLRWASKYLVCIEGRTHETLFCLDRETLNSPATPPEINMRH